jgi:hypothetical protein
MILSIMTGVNFTIAKRFFLGAVAVALGLTPQALHAENGLGTLTISPSSGSYVAGSTFTVAIQENSGQTMVNAVQADLSYDPSLLEFLDIDSSSSAFDIKALQVGGGGKVSLARAKLGSPLTGNQLIGSVTFKVIGSSGPAAINFMPSSSLLSSTSNTTIWNGIGTGASYALAATGQVTHSAPSLSTTQENLIAVKVVNSSNQPVVGAKVSLDGSTSTTDPTGIASFYNILPGSRTLAVIADNQTRSQAITIDAKPAGGIQIHEVKLAAAKYNANVLWYLALMVLILIFTFIWGNKHMRSKSSHTNHKDEK